jgi:hypothetical protein
LIWTVENPDVAAAQLVTLGAGGLGQRHGCDQREGRDE